MGTEVLHPQDILTLRLRSIPTISSRPRQQQQPSYTSPRSCRKQAAKPEPRRRRSPNPDANTRKNVAMGQVTILKRGESLDSKKSHEFRRNDLKKSVSMTESDLIICTTQRLGPDHPELVPKQISVLSPVFVRSEGVYAGSAFSQSPSPSSLPLPRFPSKKKEGVAVSVCVDDSATKDLRRLLRLE